MPAAGPVQPQPTPFTAAWAPTTNPDGGLVGAAARLSLVTGQVYLFWSFPADLASLAMFLQTGKAHLEAHPDGATAWQAAAGSGLVVARDLPPPGNGRLH